MRPFYHIAIAALLLTVVALGVLISPRHFSFAAADNPGASAKPGAGGVKAGDGGGKSGDGGVKPPSNILRSVYFLFLGFVGIAALFALTMGGVMWMFSSSLTSTEQARKWITNAIWGLAIAALSFLLLRTINEDLVRDFSIEGVIQEATKAVK